MCFRTVDKDSTFYRPPTVNQLRHYLTESNSRPYTVFKQIFDKFLQGKSRSRIGGIVMFHMTVSRAGTVSWPYDMVAAAIYSVAVTPSAGCPGWGPRERRFR